MSGVTWPYPVTALSVLVATISLNYHRGSIPLWVIVPLPRRAYTWCTLVGILRQVPGR
jgi:hypothetical protein